MAQLKAQIMVTIEFEVADTNTPKMNSAIVTKFMGQIGDYKSIEGASLRGMQIGVEVNP